MNNLHITNISFDGGDWSFISVRSNDVQNAVQRLYAFLGLDRENVGETVTAVETKMRDLTEARIALSQTDGRELAFDLAVREG